jgi:hypothetical protein
VSRRLLRVLGAIGATLAVFWAVNALGVWWLRGSQFSSNAFYDGFAAFLTLALPAFLGGLALGFLSPSQRVTLAASVFSLLAVISTVRIFWQIPLVSPQSAHSVVMHYFLYSPLALISFGLLGAWLAEQFALGRFKLADDTPVSPAQMGDD